MSHVVLVRCAEPTTSGSLESLVRRQMTGRADGTAEAPTNPAASSQARAWEALARGLWRMAAAEAVTDRAAPDRLSWTCGAPPATLFRELVPA